MAFSNGGRLVYFLVFSTLRPKNRKKIETLTLNLQSRCLLSTAPVAFVNLLKIRRTEGDGTVKQELHACSAFDVMAFKNNNSKSTSQSRNNNKMKTTIELKFITPLKGALATAAQS